MKGSFKIQHHFKNKFNIFSTKKILNKINYSSIGLGKKYIGIYSYYKPNIFQYKRFYCNYDSFEQFERSMEIEEEISNQYANHHDEHYTPLPNNQDMFGKDQKDSLYGYVDKILFHNKETGFVILNLNVNTKGRNKKMKVVGNMHSNFVEGQYIHVEGKWETAKDYGDQLRAFSIKPVMPNSNETAFNYLKSFKGIGKSFAKKLIDQFGVDIFDVIEKNPQRLYLVKGIGRLKIDAMIQSWKERKECFETTSFLYDCGIGSAHSERLYQKYGKQVEEMLKKNPYSLVKLSSHDGSLINDDGINFEIADKIAEKLGSPEKFAKQRLECAIIHNLLTISQKSGHSCIPKQMLIKSTAKMLSNEEESFLNFVSDTIDEQCDNEMLVKHFSNQVEWIYEPIMFKHEQELSEQIKRIKNGRFPYPYVNTESMTEIIEKEMSVEFSPQQKEAIHLSMKNNLLIITGGPGVGKSHTISAILRIYNKLMLQPVLAAPTGRASSRLTEITGKKATTIHRLLDYHPQSNSFLRNENNKLENTLFLIDEVSMIDLALATALFKAIPDNAIVILVGDINQLPSVAAGSVLVDLISSKFIPNVELISVFRQKKHSKIIDAAYQILQGRLPSLPSFFLPFKNTDTEHFDHSNVENSYINSAPLQITENSNVVDLFRKLKFSNQKITWEQFINEGGDFRFIECNNEKNALNCILELIKYLPKFSFDPIKDIQILTPMRKGNLGSRNINHLIQNMFHPNSNQKNSFLRNSSEKFILGDKVMQIVNNYDKDVFNGEIGIITDIDFNEKKVTVEYKTYDVVNEDKKEGEGSQNNNNDKNNNNNLQEVSKFVVYENEDLQEITTAYSMTVHKSQGCEFPVVIIVAHPQHLVMLEKNLLYTGITRSKTLTIVVGTTDAFRAAIGKSKGNKRYSFLKDRINSESLL